MKIKKGKLYKITTKSVKVGATYGFGEYEFTALTNQIIFSPQYNMDLSTYPNNSDINIRVHFGVNFKLSFFMGAITTLHVEETIEEADVSDYFILCDALRKSNLPYFFDLKSKELKYIRNLNH